MHQQTLFCLRNRFFAESGNDFFGNKNFIIRSIFFWLKNFTIISDKKNP
jgi:hypothetical protein